MVDDDLLFTVARPRAIAARLRRTDPTSPPPRVFLVFLDARYRVLHITRNVNSPTASASSSSSSHWLSTVQVLPEGPRSETHPFYQRLYYRPLGALGAFWPDAETRVADAITALPEIRRSPPVVRFFSPTADVGNVDPLAPESFAPARRCGGLFVLLRPSEDKCARILDKEQRKLHALAQFGSLRGARAARSGTTHGSMRRPRTRHVSFL